SAARFAHHADLCAGSGGRLGHGGADRIAKSHVADDAVAEESGNAVMGAVDELVWYHEIGGLVLFLERAHGGNGKDALHAQLLEGVDIGAEVQLGGQNAVAAAMARQKRHFAAFELAEHEWVGRVAKRRLDTLFV